MVSESSGRNESERITGLETRVGVENLAGYLADGVAGWIKSGFELDYIPQITVQDLSNYGSGNRTGLPCWMYVSLANEPVERSRTRCSSRSEN
jgi:hypothetical protein